MAEVPKFDTASTREREKIEHENRRMKKVITGKATTRKASNSRKFRDALFANGSGSVKEYVIFEVILPAIKNTIVDTLKGTVDMVFLGKVERDRRSRDGRSRVSYASYYDRRRDEPNRRSNIFDYDDVLFESRGDAEAVLIAMEDAIERYGWISVGGFYDLCEISTNDYMVEKYGWTNLRHADVVPVRDGYVIRLPKALPVD